MKSEKPKSLLALLKTLKPLDEEFPEIEELPAESVQLFPSIEEERRHCERGEAIQSHKLK